MTNRIGLESGLGRLSSPFFESCEASEITGKVYFYSEHPYSHKK